MNFIKKKKKRVNLNTLPEEVSIGDYHLFTYANFQSIEKGSKEYLHALTKLITDSKFSSESSSYYFDGELLYRRSDHWGKMNTCFWRIDSNPAFIGRIRAKRIYNNEFVIGKCKLSDFKRINEITPSIIS